MDWDLFVRRVNEDRLVARHGAGSSFRLLLGWGDDDHLLRVDDGRLAEHRKGPFVMPQCDFALAGSDDAWSRFAQPQPAPRDQDLFAFLRRGEIALTEAAHRCLARDRGPQGQHHQRHVRGEQPHQELGAIGDRLGEADPEQRGDRAE